MADKFEGIAIGLFIITFLVALAILGLLGWGFVELVQWVTSK
jgi:hypothetical protein